mgnify:CR=1 FL=1
MTARANGWLVLLRFLTPLMIGVLLAQFNWAQADQREFRTEIKEDIAKIRVSLENHLSGNFADLKNRLVAIETLLQVKKR